MPKGLPGRHRAAPTASEPLSGLGRMRVAFAIIEMLSAYFRTISKRVLNYLVVMWMRFGRVYDDFYDDLSDGFQ